MQKSMQQNTRNDLKIRTQMTCPTVLQNHDDVNKTIFSPDLHKHHFNQTQNKKE